MPRHVHTPRVRANHCTSQHRPFADSYWPGPIGLWYSSREVCTSVARGMLTPAGKHHKVATGDGNKPTITKENPVFNAIYKSAINELKRQICFVNASPDSMKSVNLP